MNTYTPKYALWKSTRKPGETRGRKSKPILWEQDRYYAYHKHKAQAKFRGEPYNLTLEEWKELWPEHLWVQRGRRKTDLTLYRVNHDEPWSTTNVVIVEQQHKGAYYQKDRTPGGRPKGSNNKRNP